MYDVQILRPGSGTVNFGNYATDAARGAALQTACLAARISGFNTGNLNMDTSLTVTGTSGNTASPVLTTANYTFVAGDVGNFVYIQAGTNWIPGWYQIISVGSGNATVAGAVSTVATPTAGTWTIDYSQTTGVAFTYTDLAVDSSTNTIVTSAGFPFGKNHVGNTLIITGGAGFTAARYEISSVNLTGFKATLWNLAQQGSPAATSTTGGTGTLGGPCLGDTIQMGPGGFNVSAGINSQFPGDMLIVCNGIDLIGAGKNITRIYSSTANEVLYFFGTSEARGFTVQSLGALDAMLVQSTSVQGAARLTVRDCRIISDVPSANGPSSGSAFWINGAKATAKLYNTEIFGRLTNDPGAQINLFQCVCFTSGIAFYAAGGSGGNFFAIGCTFECTGWNNENIFSLATAQTWRFNDCVFTLDSGTGTCIAMSGSVTARTVDLNNCRIIEPSGGKGVSLSGNIAQVNINGGMISGGGTDIAYTGTSTAAINVNGTRYTTTTGKINFQGPGHTVGLTAAPAMAGGVGATAGGGSTVPANTTGTDADGQISITTGATPTGTNAVIVTVTFATPFQAAPYVTLTPANANAAALATALLQPYVTSTATTFVLTSNTTGLAGATAYVWNYHVGG